MSVIMPGMSIDHQRVEIKPRSVMILQKKILNVFFLFGYFFELRKMVQS